MEGMLGRGRIDLVLVPSGLAVLLGYHLYLLYKVIKVPGATVIGYENHNKMAWVARMLRANSDEVKIAVDVISSNISASNMMASLSIALSSLIGAWVGSSTKFFSATVIYGDVSASTTSVKYISLITCFVVAFTSFIQSSRHYIHASFLVTTIDSDVPVGYVQRAVLRGGYFWSVGLRSLYFSTALLLWFFGPIPMFVCSVSMVVLLHFLDMNSEQLHPFSFKDVQVKAVPMQAVGNGGSRSLGTNFSRS